ncbi:cytosine deaminase [Agrobacterium rubi]|uniref:Cytosine deaminase n=2 Tax=Agrobacterium rubi TaxID=28099 RepID=A0AAE7R7X1_9HYPH|nr:cytosine deaminase [Agrobacterium rubi]MBP1878538.1 cytosine deaminase [Agrobacterium rubi]MCL6653098.1 cytosine deaminase [Agrobacterium rubi]NTE88847.1 cytosine deaminase [Agrobacterium rubi]NTF04675.1 cytosine deaminase [Agrobacterium rubi]NTF39237.1 cytosine deaminase [Agrobacterium rubi]
MTDGFVVLPQADRFALTNATLPSVVVEGFQAQARDGLVSADIVIANGMIEAVLPAGSARSDMPQADLRDGMIFPCFVDMHTHLDKGHVWERRPNPDGTFMGALENVRADRIAHWSRDDVRARMEFSLKAAYAHGTKLIRTHLDSIPPQTDISFPLFAEIQDEWKDRIALQAVALLPLESVLDKPVFDAIVATTKRHGGLLGGATRILPDFDKILDTMFRSAADNGLDIDLHVDETEDREVLTLEAIADAKLRHGFQGAVTVGHCCSLARQNDDTIKRVIDKVAKANISVVSLPMCNMYLQDRHAGRTPRWRGTTLFKELTAAGVPTAVASDNTRDPFYAYGDLDAVEVLREAVRILHLDHPIDEAARIVTTTPADILGRRDIGRIGAGLSADLVLFTARRWSEFLSRPQADRIVMRNGKGIDRRLPDYRDLDPILMKE